MDNNNESDEDDGVDNDDDGVNDINEDVLDCDDNVNVVVHVDVDDVVTVNLFFTVTISSISSKFKLSNDCLLFILILL